MPDLFDTDDLSYWENMGQQDEPAQQEEAAAPDEGTPEAEVAHDAPAAEADTAEEQQQQDRPRDEKGRFAKADQTADPESLQQELEQLRARLAEKDQFIGRQSTEVGELRRLIEEQTARVEQAVQQPRYQNNWESLIDEDPAQATMLAYQQGDQVALRQAAQAWNEVAPGAPAVWYQNVQLQEKIAELETRVAPVQQYEEQAQLRAGMRPLLDANPDIIDKIRSGVETGVIPGAVAETLMPVLEHGTPEQKVSAFRALAELAQRPAPNADTLNEAARNIAREQALEADRAITEATVASANAAKPEPPRKTGQDVIGEEWEAMESPYVSGWNIS